MVSRVANISGNSEANGPQFGSPTVLGPFYSGSVDKSLRILLSGAACCWTVAIGLLLFVVSTLLSDARAAEDGSALPPSLAQQVQQLTLDAGRRISSDAGEVRVDVIVGQLDSRLHLAPCQQVQPYLPANSRPWGKTRVGLRCVAGPTHWNVFLPVTVQVFAKAAVAAAALPAGSVLAAKDLRMAEVDLAAAPGTAVTQPQLAVGRTLARSLAEGDTLRQPDLKARQYFAAGETVQLQATGQGYAVHGEGQALSAGLEGQTVRVRTDGGRVVNGWAVGERRVEIPL